MQKAAPYIGHRKGGVAQWVFLRPISKVYILEQGFERRRRWRRPWWIQENLEEVLRATLLEALWESQKQHELYGVIENGREVG